jgi:hypothetical protein
MFGNDLKDLLEQKEKLTNDKEELTKCLDVVNKKIHLEMLGKYLSCWTAEEMTEKTLNEKYGSELLEFYKKERKNTEYIKNYNKLWKEEKTTTYPNIILAKVVLKLNGEITKTYVVDGELFTFYEEQKKKLKKKNEWEVWLKQHQSDSGIFSTGNPLVFISSNISIIPLNEFNYCIQSDTKSNNIPSPNPNTKKSDKVPISMLPEEFSKIHSDLKQDDYEKILNCYPLFEKYDVYVKKYYLKDRYVLHQQITIEDHHNEFWDENLEKESKDVNHSERLFTTHSRNAFEQWSTWKNLQRVELYMVSSHPICKICMVELKKFFESIFLKQEKIEFSLICFSSDKKNQQTEFDKIKNNAQSNTKFTFHQILVTEK